MHPLTNPHQSARIAHIVSFSKADSAPAKEPAPRSAHHITDLGRNKCGQRIRLHDESAQLVN